MTPVSDAASAASERLAVRDLAEFVHRRGDLHARLDSRTRAEEGIRTQRRHQQRRGGTYQCERAVSLQTVLGAVPVTLGGRIDGCDLSATPPLLEEFKTSRADPERLHRHSEAVHWAQLRLYGGLLVRELLNAAAGPGSAREPVTAPEDLLCLRLVYCHPDTDEVRSFESLCSAGELLAFLDDTLRRYDAWLERQRAHRAARDVWLDGLAFPYEHFRPHQRAMARRAFRAFRDRESLLLEAPTGSGKTAAVLYPAVRALQHSALSRVLFLTSRGTGAIAAEDALQRMDPEARSLRVVRLVARDKVCLTPGAACEPEACAYARGYYDRIASALPALLSRQRMVPEVVEEVARAHHVCPFELSLDAARWADVVIGDYNYLFDPVVRLQRFARDPRAAVLIDESHQLTARVRDMLSLELERSAVRAALAEAPPEPLGRCLRGLNRQLGHLGKGVDAAARLIDAPDALLRALQRWVDAFAAADLPLEGHPACAELLFNASRWLRAGEWLREGRFVYSCEAPGREVRLRLICLDPAGWIRERLDAYGANLRFSGTLSPLALYQRLHGFESAPAERAGNPFAADQLAVLVVPDVPTYLRARARSLEALVSLVDRVFSAAPGHYLVAFPSFEYLQQFAAACSARFPDRALHVQRPGLDDAARMAFIEALRQARSPQLALVVLGGVFGESVDFSGVTLAGVVCVGVGLPPPGLEREAVRDYFDAAGLDGALVAYRQPAMVKVLQMAGRLLRGPRDRGVLCLVDERFLRPEFRQFYPAHWHPQRVPSGEVGSVLADFWRADRPEVP
ncbi:MAG: ATP-dependent DNA helicase [Pseudomonadales bacterium]